MAMHELQRWREEKNSAYLYRTLSDLESGNPRQLLFLELAKDADEQAALWVKEIRKAREMPPVGYAPGTHIKSITWLIRWLGPRHSVVLLRVMKLRGLSVYSGVASGGHGTPGQIDEVGMEEGEHHYSEGFRTSIYGINDGLVSISLLVVGVAGATSESATILLTGIAGLLVGAVLMAGSEWFSLNSQREISEKNHPFDRQSPRQYLSAETRELALIYQARGGSLEEAYERAGKMIDDPELGLDLSAREASWPTSLVPAPPWQVATLSFFGFLFGGLIPLLPYLLEIKRHPLMIAVSLAGVVMFAAGAAISLFTGRQAVWGGIRMLIIAILAGAICYWSGGFFGQGSVD